MKKLINKIVTRIKGNEYKIDPLINTVDIISILVARGMMALRGSFRSLFFLKAKGIIFLGSKVKIKHIKHVDLGKSVTLHDHVVIDALSIKGIQIGDNVNIGSYTKIIASGTIKKLGIGMTIGENSGIGDFSFLGAAGGIEIGNNVIMGQNVRFHSENHLFTRTDIPIREQGVTNIGIVIEDDCWIGAGAVFLDGVRVGRGSVIGANSLVNRSVPAYSVAVGSPVRILKNRRRGNEK